MMMGLSTGTPIRRGQMRKAACRLAKAMPPALMQVGFAVLLVLATMPAWRVPLLGLSIEDVLQMRCLGPR